MHAPVMRLHVVQPGVATGAPELCLEDSIYHHIPAATVITRLCCLLRMSVEDAHNLFLCTSCIVLLLWVCC
jgi:hypothetical protein